MSRLRTLFGFLLVPYEASTWRRFAYAVVAVLAGFVSLLLALVGLGKATARSQRHLVRRLVGMPADEPPRRPAGPALIAVSAVITAVGVACWLLLWRFTYAILPIPLAGSLLALVLTGRRPARFRRRRAHGPAAGSTPRWMSARVAVQSIAGIMVGLACLTLLSYLAFFALANLGFPFRLAYWIKESASGGPPAPWALWSTLHRVPHHGSIWAATYPTSDGGPTLAGAWAYHAGSFLVTIFPLMAWTIRGLTRLQAWLTQALLGSPPVPPQLAAPVGPVAGGRYGVAASKASTARSATGR